MADRKNQGHKGFGTIRVRIQLPSNDDEKAIVGGVNDNIESLGADLATGLMSIVTGNTQKLKLGDYVSKINSTVTIYDYVEEISNFSKQILNIMKSIETSFGEKSILGDIRNILLDIYANNPKKDDKSSNAINIALDTSKAENLSEIIESINNLVGDAKEVNMGGLNYLEKFFTKLQSMTDENGIITNAIENTNKIPNLSKGANKNIHSLSALFTALNNLITIDPNALKDNISQLTDVFKKIESVLKEVSNIKIDDKIEIVKENLEKIKSLYENDIANTASIINKHQEDIEKIEKGSDKAVEVATSAKKVDEKDVKESETNAAELIKAITTLGVLMIIGGLIMSIYEPLITASIQFGFTLALFLSEIMIPIALLSAIQKYLGIIESTEDLADFVAISAFVMTIGALFMLIPGLADKSLIFGKVLTKFLLSILVPITLMTVFGRAKVFEYINNVGKFILLATLTMMVGAVFVGNVIMVMNALRFGEVLAQFMFLILAPIFAFGLLKMIFAAKILGSFSEVVLTSTLVMIIGALFIWAGGGKYLKGALMFGVALMAFMFLVLAPIRWYAQKAGLFAAWTIKNFTNLVLTCTLVMLIGAYFIQHKNLWMASLQFGIVLFAFISLVLLPVHWFMKNGPEIMFKTLRAITLFVLISVGLFLIGATLILKNEDYVVAGLAFGLLMFVFIGLVLLPFRIFRNTLERAFPTMVQLGVFVIACGLTIALGAYIFDKYQESAIFGALLIAGFVFLMVVAIKWLVGGDKVKGLKKNDIVNAIMLMTGIAVVCIISAIAIALVAKSGATWETMVYLTWMAAIISGMVMLVYYITQPNDPTKKGSRSKLTIDRVRNALLLMGGIALVIMLVSIAAYITKKSGVDAETMLYLTWMAAIVAGMAFLVKYISKNISEKDIIKASTSMAIIAGLFIVLSIAAAIIKLSGADAETMLYLTWMEAIVVSMFALVMLILKIDTKSADQAALILGVMAGVMIAFASALWIVKSSGADWETVGILGVMGAIAVAMLVLTMLICKISIADVTMGCIVLGVLAAILIAEAFAISLVAKSGATLETVAIISIMAAVILALGGLAIAAGFFVLGPQAVVFFAGLGVMALLLTLIAGIVGVVYMAGKAAQAVEKVKNPDELAGNIRKIFNAFIDSIPRFEIIEFFKLLANVHRVRAIAMPLAQTIMIMGRAVADVANLKVATSWDKEGNPISYRQLSERDFEMAAIGTKTIIITLADGILQASEYFDKIDNRLLWKTLYASKELGQVIGSISEGLQAFAQLMIPTKWNEEGKPIKFRQMNQTDFDLARKNIKEILITMAEAVYSVYEGHEDMFDEAMVCTKSGWFSDKYEAQPSAFTKVLKGSILLGDAISSIASGIQAFANLSIPIKWNNEGKPIKFRALKPEELIKAKDNIAQVLLTLAHAVRDVYYMDPSLFDEEVFVSKSTWFKTEYSTKPSKFMRVLSASQVLAEVISGIAGGIRDFATMQIADKWDSNGKPIHYITLGQDDFVNASKNIGKVLCALVEGVKGAYDIMNGGSFNGFFYKGNGVTPEKFKEITESLVPLGTLVGGLGKGIKEMANLKFEIYDNKGKVIGYTTLADEDFKQVGENIKTILIALVNGVLKGYNAYKDIMDPARFKEITEAFLPLTELVNGMAKAIVEYGKSEFKDANGNRIKITPALMTEAADSIGNLMTGIVNAVINAYNKNKDFFKSGSEGSLSMISSELAEVGSLTKDFTEIIEKFSKISINSIENSLGKLDALFGIPYNDGILDIFFDALSRYKNPEDYAVFSNGVVILSTAHQILNIIFNDIVQSIIDNRKNLNILCSTHQVSRVKNEYYGIFADLYYIINSISGISIYADKMADEMGYVSYVKIYDLFSIFKKVSDNLSEIIPKINNLSSLLHEVSYDETFTVSVKGIIGLINDTLNVVSGDISSDEEKELFSIFGYHFKVAKNKDKLKIENDVKLLIDKVNSFSSVIEQLNIAASIINGFNGINQNDADKIITSAKKISETIDGLYSTFDSSKKGFIFDLRGLHSLNIIKEKVNTFTEIVNSMIKASSGDLTNSELFTQIADGIDTINAKVNTIDVNKQKSLKLELENLDKFVKTVNKVDSGKTDKLASLMDKMAELANSLGGFDKLVKLLDGDFIKVLNKLNETVEEAKETISAAERINVRRQKQFEENIQKLGNVMKRNIVVGVGDLDNDGNIKVKDEK